MRFVDEAKIKFKPATAGAARCELSSREIHSVRRPRRRRRRQGRGHLSRRREQGINTLADFRYNRAFRAPARQPQARATTAPARGGTDLIVEVPIGTVVVDVDTEEQLGDMTEAGQRLLVGEGRQGRLGQYPLQEQHQSHAAQGPCRVCPVEKRDLRLELKVMADIGLLGLPNAGKSTLDPRRFGGEAESCRLSVHHPAPESGCRARRRPSQLRRWRTFRDLIEGAAEGAGLGIQFLKHLQRTRVLLHLIDVQPPDPEADPVKDARAIVAELKKFSAELGEKERWLVLNKVDLLPPRIRPTSSARTSCAGCAGRGRVYRISGLARLGTEELCESIMTRLEEIDAPRRSGSERIAIRKSRAKPGFFVF